MSKKRNDIILVVVLLLISVAGLLLYKVLTHEGNVAVVLIDGNEVVRFSLSEDREYIIETEKGKNTLVIKDGKADIVLADCPDGVCVDHKPISKVRETIVCLPHGVVVVIEASQAATDDIDMVA